MHRNKVYRQDINSLRAISVLGVLLFHLKIDLFAGGYVGVDVFFVISGYLIIKNIATEIENTGTFGLMTFYKKRARRLLPALLVTVACTLPVGMLLLNTEHLRGMAGSAIYALTSTSNIYFWQEGGYFAVSGQYKPLLHTWSLSVEEQFYLIFPIILIITYKISRAVSAIALFTLLVASLLLSDYLYYDGKPYAVFFFMPTRIFEFLIGGILVFLPRYKTNRIADEILSLSGLGLIIWAMVNFNSSTPNPTLYALIPCMGAALVIYSGQSLSKSLLEQRFIRWTGEASYALYLVHWPVIVFYLYVNPGAHNSLTANLILVSGIALLTFALHNLVEKPFRYKSSNNLLNTHFGFAYLSVSAAVIVIAAILWSKGTLLWRNSVAYYDREEIALKNETIARYDNEMKFALRKFTDKQAVAKLLFVGDSHANDVAQAIFLGGQSEDIEFEILRFDTFCQPTQDYRHALARFIAGFLNQQTDCDEQLSFLASDQRIQEATHIFIANLNTPHSVSFLPKHMEQVANRSTAQLIVVGQNAIYKDVDDLHFRRKVIEKQLPEYLYDRQSDSDKEINNQLRAAATKHNFYFLDRASLICNNDKARCTVEDENGDLLYLDSNHWNNFGRVYYGKLMVDLLRIDNVF